MLKAKEEDRDTEDAAPIQHFRNLRLSSGGQNKKSDVLPRQTGVLSCGHQMPPDYLISWCKYYLMQEKTEFTCPRLDENKKGICGTKFSYQDLCNTVSLTSSLKEFFEERLGELTASSYCEFKACPGCESYVERADQENLCVHCTVCTARMGRSYEFCWDCRRKWKGAVQNTVHCGYSDCRETETLQTKRDLLKLCQPAFKQRKLQTEQIYSTKEKSSDRKRLAMIINNVEFTVREYNRNGAEMDEENMKTLLEALGYDVIILNDLSAEGMEAALRDFSQHNEHKNSDSTFFIIMSHGGPNGIYGIHSDEKDDDIFPVDKIFYYLSSENCPGLTDKPKIILIQACRGDKKGHVWVFDGVKSNKGTKQHREKDFACLRSCTPDTVSIRNPDSGTIFFKILVEIFNEHSHENDIVELFTKILHRFEKKAKEGEIPYQMPCMDRTTLVKKFYLFPGL
ncbi:caspase-23 isoform X1 [Ictalurus punctatus]|uniref:Caspase-1 n=1 Tax=Ictalurus punctatus TaxID=7998 RepID=W5ULP2_ICTPU|nr:caspase-23 isoform X1 [Ictalurus punctatus]